MKIFLKKILNKNLVKQIIVLLALTIILIYNQNGASVQSNLESSSKSISKENLVMSGAVLEYRISNILNSNPIDFYRLVFDIKVKPGQGFVSIDGIQNNALPEGSDSSGVNSSFKIQAISEADSRILAETAVQGSNDYTRKEIYFQAGGRYSDLMIFKSNKEDNEVYIKNLRITRLNISNESELAKLKPYLAQNTSIYKKSIPVDGTGLEPIFRFRKSREVVGQIFKADFDYLAAVSFRLDFKGKSKGVYTLLLNKAKYENGQYIVDPVVLTQQFFSQDDVGGYAESGQNGVYKFPLTYALEKDQYYYVNIDGVRADVNLLNHLEVFGIKSFDNKNGIAGQAKGEGKIKELGNLYFKLYTADLMPSSGNLLNGVLIEDLGGGKGIYNYQTKANITDFFDISEKSRSESMAYYANDAIIVPAEKDNHVLYDIKTIYPFNKMLIKSSTLGKPNYDSMLYYSFNKKDWIQINPKKHQDEGMVEIPTSFEAIINGEGHNQLYLKFTYDDKTDGRKAKSFGISSLTLSGDLNTN